jgi:hypothetical protein
VATGAFRTADVGWRRVRGWAVVSVRKSGHADSAAVIVTLAAVDVLVVGIVSVVNVHQCEPCCCQHDVPCRTAVYRKRIRRSTIGG